LFRKLSKKDVIFCFTLLYTLCEKRTGQDVRILCHGTLRNT